jgi:hypothetical protein
MILPRKKKESPHLGGGKRLHWGGQGRSGIVPATIAPLLLQAIADGPPWLNRDKTLKAMMLRKQRTPSEVCRNAILVIRVCLGADSQGLLPTSEEFWQEGNTIYCIAY